MTGSGCLSRILGPICVSVLYAKYGTFWLSLTTSILMIIPMSWLILIRDRLYIKTVELKNVELEDLSQKTSNNLIKDKSVIQNGEKDKFLMNGT